MVHLTLLRHAKADWGNPEMADRDRVLNARGRRASAQIGEYLRASGQIPDEVLCSAARRTQETLQRLGTEFSQGPKVHIQEELYLASPHALLGAIESLGSKATKLLVIAHNPGIEELAFELSGRGAGSGSAGASMQNGFPTAALAVFECEEPFEDIRYGAVKLVDFMTPKMLRDIDS